MTFNLTLHFFQIKRYTLLLFIITLTACNSAPNQDNIASASLFETKWQLLKFELQPIHNSGITLKLINNKIEHRIQGYSGCNQYFGKFERDADLLKLEPLGATKRACRDMVAERYYNQMLLTTNRYEINGSQLRLYHHKTLLMTFVAHP